MKVYYSHAMPLYETKQELNERKQIFKKFPKAVIVDPGTYQNNPEKQREGMEYCLRLVQTCQALVYSKFNGKITAGVGKEVNFALDQKIDVFELNGNELQKITKPVEHLSIMDTISLPGYFPKR